MQTAYIFNNALYCITREDTCEGAQFGDVIRFPLFVAGAPITFTFISSIYVEGAKLVFMRQRPGVVLLSVDIKTFSIQSQTIKKQEHEKES